MVDVYCLSLKCPVVLDHYNPYSISDSSLKIHWKDSHLTVRKNQSHADDFLLANFTSKLFDNHQKDEFFYINAKQDLNWIELKSWFWLSYYSGERVLRRTLNTNGEQFYADEVPGTVANITQTTRKENEWRLQMHNDWHIDNKNQIQFGLEFRRIDLPENTLLFSFDDASSREITLLPEVKRDIYGIYSEYQSKISNSSHLTLGLRYDNFSGLAAQLSPRAGWIQDITPHQTLKFLYGQAFRAPTESELNVSNNSAVTGTPDLQAETVQSIDIIWMGQWGKSSVTAGYFENHFEDAIVQISQGSQLRYMNSNNDEHTRGYELELSFELGKNLIIQSTLTHLSSKPELAFREASRLASITINYQFNRWNFNLNSSYHDERQMENLNNERLTLNSYWLTFAKINYSLSDKWETFLQFKNLGNNSIEGPPSFPRSFGGTPHREREIQLGIELRW